MSIVEQTKEKILELILKSIPYPHQISDIDLTSNERAIQFTWRHTRFRVTLSGSVETVSDGVLIGGNCSDLLLKQLLKVVYLESI